MSEPGIPVERAGDAPERPPYGIATLVGLGVLALYAVTLAPTTQFWDTSEYIAAAKVLGIPHPPGNPLFVLLANVWGKLVPLADYGARMVGAGPRWETVRSLFDVHVRRLGFASAPDMEGPQAVESGGRAPDVADEPRALQHGLFD